MEGDDRRTVLTRDGSVASSDSDDHDVDSSAEEDAGEAQLRMLLGTMMAGHGGGEGVPRQVLMRQLMLAMGSMDDLRHRPDTESAPTDWNDQLVAFLEGSHRLQSEDTIAAFRAVDRGIFVPAEHREQAYHDTPLRKTVCVPHSDQQAVLHLSQPTMYAETIENLMVQPGDSVLNVGSGSGYLSLIFAFLVRNPSVGTDSLAHPDHPSSRNSHANLVWLVRYPINRLAHLVVCTVPKYKREWLSTQSKYSSGSISRIRSRRF